MDSSRFPQDKSPSRDASGAERYQASSPGRLGLRETLQLAVCFVNQWDMFISTGMSRGSPWRVTRDGRIYACDFKATFDENNFKFKDIGFKLPEYPNEEDAFDEEMRAWSAASYQGQAHVSSLGGKKILPILFGGGASTIIIETLAQLDGPPLDFGGNRQDERRKRGNLLRHRKDAALLLILGGKANNTQIDVTLPPSPTPWKSGRRRTVPTRSPWSSAAAAPGSCRGSPS
jgi:hypothetical protein